MTPEAIAQANDQLRNKSALEVVEWAIAQADGRAIVSTNFRPYEAVILHLVTQAQPDIPVLWVDHGYNREATYKHSEELRSLLNLNITPSCPSSLRRITMPCTAVCPSRLRKTRRRLRRLAR